jgi:hypothetical protein
MEIDYLSCFKGRIKYQSLDDLKPDALPNGSIGHFMATFRMYEGESYPEEWAMLSAEGRYWIPSSEIELLEEISIEEYRRIEDELKPRNLTLDHKPWYTYSKTTNQPDK